jgi:GntR family transcriptional regulator
LPVPLYHQVFGSLKQRVFDGSYEIGQQLPPEDDLAAEFDVSRATIRQAVGQLVSDGLVSRKQGRGTFVLDGGKHKIGQRFRGSLADLIAETRRAKIRNVEIDRDAHIPKRLAEQLGLEEPHGVIVRRTRLIDGNPFAYTINYMSSEFGELLDEKALYEQGMMQLLSSKGVTFTGATQSIRAQLADVAVGERLGVDFGEPVLFVERVLHAGDSKPVEAVRSWYRGDEYEYTVNFDSVGGEEDLSRHLA